MKGHEGPKGLLPDIRVWLIESLKEWQTEWLNDIKRLNSQQKRYKSAWLTTQRRTELSSFLPWTTSSLSRLFSDSPSQIFPEATLVCAPCFCRHFFSGPTLFWAASTLGCLFSHPGLPWASCSLSYFCEATLLWATSSLSQIFLPTTLHCAPLFEGTFSLGRLFSELALLWAATSLCAIYCLSCLPLLWFFLLLPLLPSSSSSSSSSSPPPLLLLLFLLLLLAFSSVRYVFSDSMRYLFSGLPLLSASFFSEMHSLSQVFTELHLLWALLLLATSSSLLPLPWANSSLGFRWAKSELPWANSLVGCSEQFIPRIDSAGRSIFGIILCAAISSFLMITDI